MTHGSITQQDTLPTTTWAITIGASATEFGPPFAMTDGQTMLIEVRVVGHRASGSGGGAIVAMACFSNDGGTVTQVGATKDIFYAVDSDLVGTSITWEVASSVYIQAQINSTSANSYYWHASIRTEQINEVA